MTRSAALAVQALARPATRRRFPDGERVGGKWIEGAPVDTPIRAVIQATSAADLQRLPEGDRVEGMVTVWTRADLRTADEAAKTRADEVITPRGQAYEIVRVLARDEGGFTRAIGRLARDGGRSV